jgi:hypothetical protein
MEQWLFETPAMPPPESRHDLPTAAAQQRLAQIEQARQAVMRRAAP